MGDTFRFYYRVTLKSWNQNVPEFCVRQYFCFFLLMSVGCFSSVVQKIVEFHPRVSTLIQPSFQKKKRKLFILIKALRVEVQLSNWS